MAKFTPEQKERIKDLTFNTDLSAEQIAEKVGASPSGVSKFQREILYRDDKEAYDKRVEKGKNLTTPEQVKEIERWTLTTRKSQKEIATLTHSSETTVRNTQKDIIFKGNHDAYKQHAHEVRAEGQRNRTIRKKKALSPENRAKIIQRLIRTNESRRSIKAEFKASDKELDALLYKAFKGDPNGRRRRFAQGLEGIEPKTRNRIEYLLKDTTQSIRSISDDTNVWRGLVEQVAEEVYKDDPDKLQQRLELNKAEISPEKEQEAIHLIETTELSFNEIGEKVGVTHSYVGNLSKNKVFRDDPEMHEARALLGYQNLNPEKAAKVEDKVLHTSQSFEGIGDNLGISGAAVQYRAKKLYENDPIKYQERASDGKIKIGREKREQIIKDIKETSDPFNKISVKNGVCEETVRQTALNHAYKCDPDGYENRVRLGKGLVDLPTEKRVIADIEKNDGKSIRKIAAKNNVSSWYVQETAFNKVHNGNLETYQHQFPENRLEDATKTWAIELIRTTNLNEIQIAKKLSSEGKDCGAYSVWRLAIKEYPDRKTRDERFPMAKAHRTGRYMHVVLEDSVKQHLAAQHAQDATQPCAYKEVTPHNLPSKHAGENLRADLIIPNTKQYLQHHLDHLNTEQKPLAAELNLNPEQLSKIREIRVDFSRNDSKYNLLEKKGKYVTPDSLVLVIVTGEWYGEERVKEVAGLPPNMKVIRPDLFADIIQLPETERVKWEQVIEAGERFNIHALKEMAHQCDTTHDQEAYDRDCPTKPRDDTLDKYLAKADEAKSDVPTQDRPAAVADNERETSQDQTAGKKEGAEQPPGDRPERASENSDAKKPGAPDGADATPPDRPADAPTKAHTPDQTEIPPEQEPKQVPEAGEKNATLDIPDYDHLKDKMRQPEGDRLTNPLVQADKQQETRIRDNLIGRDPGFDETIPDYDRLPADDPSARDIPDYAKETNEETKSTEIPDYEKEDTDKPKEQSESQNKDEPTEGAGEKTKSLSNS